MTLKDRFLRLIRKTTTGKIELVQVCGSLIRIQGWTNREDARVRIYLKKINPIVFDILLRPSTRDDLERFGIPIYEFNTILDIAGKLNEGVRIGLLPKVRLQKRRIINKSDFVDRHQMISSFGLQTLAANRKSLDQVDTENLKLAIKEKLFERIKNSVVQMDGEECALIIILKPADSNAVHSQLLLLELSKFAEKPYRILFLTEAELDNYHKFAWSALVREHYVEFGSLEFVGPSEFAIALKKHFSNLSVTIIREGENVASLAGLLSELDQYDHLLAEGTIVLQRRDSLTTDTGAGLVLGNGLPGLRFPRAPLNDWDFIEFSKAISKFRRVETESLIGKKNSALESALNQFPKQIRGLQ